MAVVVYNKHYGETLKVMLERFRCEHPHYADSKLTYAGRLDPLAQGVVIILTDEDVHKKEAFLGLPKVYEVTILFGAQTDTYDLLGIPNKVIPTTITINDIQHCTQKSIGEQQQPYPPYSSRTVNGKPLYQWAREGRLNEITIPTQTIEVYRAHVNSMDTITNNELLNTINSITSLVEGDFRQNLIQSQWEQQIPSGATFYTANLTFEVSSGSYIRGLVHSLSVCLGIPACCMNIKRILVGNYLTK